MRFCSITALRVNLNLGRITALPYCTKWSCPASLKCHKTWGRRVEKEFALPYGSGTLRLGTNIVKPLFALEDLLSVCICISFLPAHFQALFYLYPHLLGSRKLLYLDLSIMIFSIWVDLCNFPSAGNSPCNSQNFCLMAFRCKERSEGLLQTVAKHRLQ